MAVKSKGVAIQQKELIAQKKKLRQPAVNKGN
jgi:hypothetical protein